MVAAGLAALVFVAAALLDIVEAYYVRSVADASPHRAALYSVAMYIVGCAGFFAVLDYSYWLMIPECAGLFVGSVIAIRRQRATRQAACQPTAASTNRANCATMAETWPSASTSVVCARPGSCLAEDSSATVH